MLTGKRLPRKAIWQKLKSQQKFISTENSNPDGFLNLVLLRTLSNWRENNWMNTIKPKLPHLPNNHVTCDTSSNVTNLEFLGFQKFIVTSVTWHNIVIKYICNKKFIIIRSSISFKTINLQAFFHRIKISYSKKKFDTVNFL